jgi:glycosyltransferase involved in cell wall biosynthesis
MNGKPILPGLSVVVPNYNHARYLPECLESLLQQSVQPLEIIVIDDCSTDNSIAVLEDFCRNNPRVTFCRNEKNLGVLATLNKGAQMARGEYVVFPGADDRVLPGYFEKALSLLARHPQAGLCFFDPGSFDHVTGVISENRMRLSPAPAFFSPEDIAKIGARRRLIITGNCVFKHSALVKAGGFPLKLRWHADYFLAFHIAFMHGACYVPEPLALWRVMPSSYMNKGVKQFRVQRGVAEAMLDVLNSDAYRGVAGCFRRSGALVWVPFVVPTILLRRKYWHMLSFPLLKRFWMVDFFSVSPHWLQRLIRRARAGLG